MPYLLGSWSVRSLNLTEQGKDKRFSPLTISLLVTQGTPENWGELEPLRGTTWGQGVSLIDGDTLSHALHGNLMPLYKALGREPQATARRISPQEGSCSQKGVCIRWNPDLCRPGGKDKNVLGPPDCYEPPIVRGTTAVIDLFTTVALAWKEGRYTVVMTSDGFNLR